ncbi:DUF2911 domain-containing protein [Fulvivirga sedimenti]|uniref:DUF2911 domain-containing protein n=1 Tax=Fulvivirga sedimenti TaxID=2879465 RepID=A0A9X1HL29_9BACT|nr:DUF2911 domain-containing protein [Fulvivirga sedimenti]MCA6073866.1 DUF2911 domain-containing protein [Fulvivirga sedimenti]
MRILLSIVLSGLCIVGFSDFATAQQQMKSPPATVNAKVGGANVEIKYSQPSARGRSVMGGLVPYGEVWRTGANAATIISFDKDVTIEGKKLAKGSYSMYTIPGEKNWVIIFNSATGQWGTQYSDDKDALRVEVPAGKTGDFVETFTISAEGDHVSLAWENTEVKFKVKG